MIYSLEWYLKVKIRVKILRFEVRTDVICALIFLDLTIVELMRFDFKNDDT